MKINLSVTMTKLKFKNFENSIHNKNDAYYVDLPRDENEIKKFPSNYPVALKILLKKTTNNHLESKNLIKDFFLPSGERGNK